MAICPIPDDLLGRRFHAPGLVVEIAADPRRGATLVLTREGERCCPPVPVRIVGPAEAATALADQDAAPLVRYPGGARHAAGGEAGLSWFNDQGEGWLRIIQPPHAVIILPLCGWERPSDALAIPQRGRRGPPKSMDLWLAVAALLRPLGIDGGLLHATTGINRFNVYDWLSRAATAGLLVRLPGRDGRTERFLLPPASVPLLGEFVRAGWVDWRRGRTIARLQPQTRSFVATGDWGAMATLLPHDAEMSIVPTGVTWLEGQGGGPARLTPSGSIPRVDLLCRADAWQRLVANAHLAPRASRERAYDSQALILAEDHPLWAIIAQRQRDAFAPPWPGGLRALDALQDPEPRVREAAEAAWSDWLAQHRIHIEERMGSVHDR